MILDRYRNPYFSVEEAVEALYRNPSIDVSKFLLDGDTDEIELFNAAVDSHYVSLPHMIYVHPDTIDHETHQQNWYMPDSYKNLDIAEWVLSRCETDAELQRCGEELLIFQRMKMFPLLQYLKYFVDTMREKGVVWGVGRGSSTASHVLYLIGVHKINSMYYGLDIGEFLREGKDNDNQES